MILCYYAILVIVPQQFHCTQNSTGCASNSELKNLSEHGNKSNAVPNESIALPKDADGSSEFRETEDTTEVELWGCEGGTRERACVDGADKDTGGAVEATDTQMSSLPGR